MNVIIVKGTKQAEQKAYEYLSQVLTQKITRKGA